MRCYMEGTFSDGLVNLLATVCEFVAKIKLKVRPQAEARFKNSHGVKYFRSCHAFFSRIILDVSERFLGFIGSFYF